MTNIDLIGRHAADTGMCSVMHHAKEVSTTYDQIIAKGWDIVPDILYYLEEYHGGMHVIMLLMDITGEKPYLPEVPGHWNVPKCRRAWIEWGKKHYSPPEEKMYPESYVKELLFKIETLEIIKKAFEYLAGLMKEHGMQHTQMTTSQCKLLKILLHSTQNEELINEMVEDGDLTEIERKDFQALQKMFPDES